MTMLDSFDSGVLLMMELKTVGVDVLLLAPVLRENVVDVDLVVEERHHVGGLRH